MLNLLRKKIKPVFLAIILIIGVSAVFGLGFSTGKNSAVCEVCPPSDIDFSLFWQAWRKLEERYIDPGKLDVQKMIYGAVAGMVESLEDPYTVFFTPEETKKFMEDVSGSFEGIGMEVGIRDGQLQIVAPLEGMPAQKAGLRSGDKIVKIGDKLTADITIEEAVALIRGPKGTDITLTIFRDDWKATRDFKIKREVINVPSLKWEIKDEDIAYIKIQHFSENADTDFQRAALKILKTPAQKIILDLRNNPGGYLEISQRIAGWFLKLDDIVVIEDFGGKEEQKIYKARGNSNFSEYPIVILINEGTASASEILASAIKDNRADVRIIGINSFGKGSVQELEDLNDNSSLKITIAKWLTPKGELITDKGIKPDIEVKMSEEDYNEEKDPQLDRAIEIIKEMK